MESVVCNLPVSYVRFHVKFFLYIINDIVKVESAQFKEILGYSLNKTKLHRN